MGNSIRILIVEDREADAELMALALRREGFEVDYRRVERENEYLAELKKPYDLILSDWSLPQFSGMRALELMKGCGKDIPFILVSGSIGEDAAIELTHKGADDYVLKEHLIRLGKAVTHALDGKHLREEKRRADVALRESEQRYRQLFENSLEGIGLSQGNRVIDANKALLDMFGYQSLQELTAVPLLELVAPESREMVREKMRQVEAGSSTKAHYTYKIIRQDGQMRDIEISSEQVRIGEADYRLGTFRDITERIRIEQANALISDTERQIVRLDSINEIIELVGSRVLELASNSIIGITLLDEKLQAMRIAKLYGMGDRYEKIARMFKVDPTTYYYFIKDMSPEDLATFRSGKLEKIEGGIHRLLLGKAPKRICAAVEKELKLTGIYSMGFSWQGIHFGGITILAREDITPYKAMIEVMINQASISIKRIHTEEALRASEEKFRGVMEQSTDGIMIMDDKGIVVECNEEEEEILGYEKSELLGKPMWEVQYRVTPPEHQTPQLLESIKKRILLIIEKRPAQFFGKGTETKICRKDGTRRDIEFTVYPIHIGSRFLIGSTTRDITERKQAEKTLRESEARFRIVFENANDAIFIENEKDEIILANQRACEMMGYSLEELVKMRVPDLQAPEVRRPSNTLIKELEDHGSAVFEAMNLHSSGRRIPVEVSVARIERPGDDLYISIVRDVTERKQMTEALQASEERYRTLAETAHDMIFMIGRNLQIEYVNDFAARMIQSHSTNALGKPVGEVFRDKMFKSKEDNLKKIFDTGDAIYNESTMEFPSGIYWLGTWLVPIKNAEGGVTSVFGIARDITKRKQAEEALAKTEQIYRRAITQAGGVPFQRMHGSQEYAFLGEGFETLTGYSLQEMNTDLFDSRLKEIEVKDEFKNLSHEERMSLSQNGVMKEWREDYLFEKKDGHLIWLADRSVPVYDNKGKVIGSLGILTDITDRKEAEAELAYQAEELRRRNDEMARLYRASSSLITGVSLNLQEQAEKIAEVVQQEFGRDNCSLFTFQNHTEEVTCLTTAGPFASQVNDTIRLSLHGPGLIPRALRMAQSLNVADVRLEPDYLPAWEAARSELAIPLKIGENVIGLIDVQSAEVNAFSQDDERLMSIFAERAALALEHSRLNTQMEARIRQLTALRTIDMAISGSFDIHLTLGILLDQVTAELNFTATDVLLFNPATQTLTQVCERGFKTQILQSPPLNHGTGYAWQVIHERRMVSTANLQTDTASQQKSPQFSRDAFESYLGIPLIAKGQIRGVLEIFHRGPIVLESEWSGFLELLAGQAAIAIDNAELFENLQSSNSELSMAYDNTLEGWANALELRDHETGGHTRRATEMTVRLAQAMGVRQNDIVHIYRGALLHDIGKMGVPDSIIRKEGPLTDEEWVIMRKHPQYAYDLLSPISYLKLALDIPYCHHEKWDGSGYPRGLKGEQIPLAARIFAVVDVWDALTSDRPYREGWSQEKTLNYIGEQAGKHFDPKVVETFLREVKHD